MVAYTTTEFIVQPFTEAEGTVLELTVMGMYRVRR